MSPTPSRTTLISLAIETTGRSGSVAILKGDAPLRSYYLDDRTRTAASLAPCIKQALDDCVQQGWEVSLVCVADGPGSFTGLRIGVTTAKMLAYAKKLPLVSVDSVAAVAASVLSDHAHVQRIAVALDAYRGQAFIGQFTRQMLLPELDTVTDLWTAHPASVRIAQAEELTAFLSPATEDLWFAGDAKVLDAKVPAELRLERRRPAAGGRGGVDAVGVGRLALRSWLVGRLIAPAALVPRYLRPSAAEEKAAIPSGDAASGR